MSANDKLAATFHPHPSYTAMEAAWDPVRRAAYPGERYDKKRNAR